jgi:hypothetical protein
MKQLIQSQRPWTQLCRLGGLSLTVASLLVITAARSADEYTGKLDPQLVANRDDHEQVVFRPMRDLARIKIAKPTRPPSRAKEIPLPETLHRWYKRPPASNGKVIKLGTLKLHRSVNAAIAPTVRRTTKDRTLMELRDSMTKDIRAHSKLRALATRFVMR